MRLDGLATQLEPSIVPVIIGSSASAIHGSSRSLISSRTQGRDANSVESIPSHLETRACERPSLPSSLPCCISFPVVGANFLRPTTSPSTPAPPLLVLPPSLRDCARSLHSVEASRPRSRSAGDTGDNGPPASTCLGACSSRLAASDYVRRPARQPLRHER